MTDFEDFSFDDLDDNDDIIADYDAGDGVAEPIQLSEAEIERKYTAFEQEVTKRRTMLRKPKNFPAAERIAAAKWLGESGEIQAIPDLVLVYNRDKTPGMKEAATYALGQMKALQDALDDPETQEIVLDNLNEIITRDAFGKRFNRAKFMIPQTIGLAVSFIVLIFVGFIVGGIADSRQEAQEAQAKEETAIAPTPTPDTFEFAVDDLTNYYSALIADATALQGQMSLITQGRSPDGCPPEFNNPPAYTLSAARQDDPNLPEITDSLNTIRTDLLPIREAFTTFCETQVVISRAEGLELAQDVIAVQNSLREVETLFSAEAGIEAPPTLVLTATPEIQPTVEPTVDLNAIRPYTGTLNSIIRQMTDITRGDATVQAIYWQNIIEFGSSEGCQQPAIVVQEDYVLPGDIANDFPRLQDATNSVNTGLQLMRESVAPFATACQDPGSAIEPANIGLAKANLAIDSFREAEDIIIELGG